MSGYTSQKMICIHTCAPKTQNFSKMPENATQDNQAATQARLANVKFCSRDECMRLYLAHPCGLSNCDQHLLDTVFYDDIGYKHVFELIADPIPTTSKFKIEICCLLFTCKCKHRISYSPTAFRNFQKFHKDDYDLLRQRKKLKELDEKREEEVFWHPEWSLKPEHPDYRKMQEQVADLIKCRDIILGWERLHRISPYPNKSPMLKRITDKCSSKLCQGHGHNKFSDSAIAAKLKNDRMPFYIPVSRCKIYRNQHAILADQSLMKDRVCKHCKSNENVDAGTEEEAAMNDRTLLHYNFNIRYTFCVLCRIQPQKENSFVCEDCGHGLLAMKDRHADHKTVFKSSMLALLTTFKCTSIVVVEEQAVMDEHKTNVTKFIDAVTTFVVGDTRHVFMIEFQNTGREVESTLIHKFHKLCLDPITKTEEKNGARYSKYYLVCVYIADHMTKSRMPDYGYDHKLDILRSWMLVAMQHKDQMPEKSLWWLFYEKHETNGKLNGLQNTPLHGPHGTEFCLFLQNPLILNAAPKGSEECDWKYCCDVWTIPLKDRENWDEENSDLSKKTRRSSNKIGDHAIDTATIFQRIVKIQAKFANKQVIHCMIKGCDNAACKH